MAPGIAPLPQIPSSFVAAQEFARLPLTFSTGLSALVSPDIECFTYADETSVTSCIQALTDLEEYIEENGPYDGVMAFSSGAGLAATLLILQERRHSTHNSALPMFKCAIFFCGGVPADPNVMLEQNEISILTPEDGVLIKIPTAHIWGANDMLYPNFGPVLRSLCQKNIREEYIHGGGHEIPSSDRVAVASSKYSNSALATQAVVMFLSRGHFSLKAEGVSAALTAQCRPGLHRIDHISPLLSLDQ
ncbi:hypothetical protein N431DRAFT_445996 [Stipitochalara longipes BDJ]|nr:hypothetical protein N431DRAFT_445996 [Stipitochalara longipes BDJ]